MNRVDTYSQPIAEADELLYYYNGDLITDATFSNWRVALLHTDSNIVAYNNIVTLTQDVITGSQFRWYFEWTVPALVEGCYRLVVYNSTDSSIKFMSETLLQFVEDTTDTAIIKYRNEVNIQNFNYESLTTWYNQYRLFFKRRAPQRQKNTIGYNVTEGTFNRVRTVITKSYEFVTDFLDENASDALDIATIHSDLKIDVGTGLQSYRLPDDSDFEQEWTDFYNLADASVRLELISYSSSNKTK